MGSTHNQAAQTVHAHAVQTHAAQTGPAPAYDWDQLALELSNTAWDTPPRSQITPPRSVNQPLPSNSLAEASDSNSSSNSLAEASDSNSSSNSLAEASDPNSSSNSLAEASDSNSSSNSLAEASDPNSSSNSLAEASDSKGSPSHAPSTLLDLLTDPALTIPQLCDHLSLSPTQLAEALSQGHLAQLLSAARTIAAARADLIEHQARTDATDALRHITLNENASPETRRKAATTLLRASHTNSRPSRRPSPTGQPPRATTRTQTRTPRASPAPHADRSTQSAYTTPGTNAHSVSITHTKNSLPAPFRSPTASGGRNSASSTIVTRGDNAITEPQSAGLGSLEDAVQRVQQAGQIEQNRENDVQDQRAADALLEPHRQRRDQDRDDHEQQHVGISLSHARVPSLQAIRSGLKSRSHAPETQNEPDEDTRYRVPRQPAGPPPTHPLILGSSRSAEPT